MMSVAEFNITLILVHPVNAEAGAVIVPLTTVEGAVVAINGFEKTSSPGSVKTVL